MVGGGWWVCKPILVISFAQADQLEQTKRVLNSRIHPEPGYLTKWSAVLKIVPVEEKTCFTHFKQEIYSCQTT